MLNSLAPGRIDLGLGRAPGTDGATAAALRRHHNANDNFPQQVAELLAFMNDSFPEGHPYSHIHAVPGPWQAQENRVEPSPHTATPWILGSSEYSAYLAAELGRLYAFALQFGGSNVDAALNIYRDNFKPSETQPEPYTLVSTSIIVSQDPEEAHRQALSSAMAMLRMFKRESFKLLPPQEVIDYKGTLQEQEIIASYATRNNPGTAAQAAEKIEALQERTGANEIMLVTGGSNRDIQLETIEEIAAHYDMGA